MEKEFRMNMQLFGEPGGAADGATAQTSQTEGVTNGTTTPQTQAEGQAQQTFTQEDVQRLIQAETDRRVTQALQKQKKEYEKKLSLSGLDEQQRAAAEKDQRIEELEEQLRTANAERALADLVKALAARGLPTSFADLIDVGADAEEAQRRVDALDKGFKAAVEDAVKARLSGGAPGKGGASTAKPTREEFAKLPLAELQKMAKENPELYREMAQ